MNFSRRIIVKFKDSFPLPYLNDKETRAYLLKNYAIPWKELFKTFPGITIGKLFTSINPKEIVSLVELVQQLSTDYTAPKFLTYFAIDCSSKTNTYKLLKVLLQNENVEMAYIESEPASCPCIITGKNPLNKKQGYLDPAPKGVDARYGWTINGGCGEGKVQFIDIEYAWVLNHEDIKDANVKFLWGFKKEKREKSHGASVLGIILMQDNNFGGIGITHKIKNAQVVSIVSPSGKYAIHDAIMKAIHSLNFGDILLLEVQKNNDPIERLLRSPKRIYWPIELDQAIFSLIHFATKKGIIVIEPAGNGTGIRGYNLNKISDENGKKILDKTSKKKDFKDSGAIIVGAGSNKVTSLNKHGKRRSSNYGNRVDCYAWGSNVYTADDPSKKIYKPKPHRKARTPYIKFSATSCASAIIAGVAIAIQSMVEASGKHRLSPSEMRDILNNPLNGTQSVKNKIGVMPDLKRIINNVLPGLHA